VGRHHLTVQDVVDDLRRLGRMTGDAVVVHASLRAIGPVEGGAEGVVRALDTAVGPEGTVLMYISARDDWAWVNDYPEPERAALLRDTVPFDHLRTPADPDNGVLAEVFRQLPGTVVNNHPEARFGARGRRAEQFLDDVPWHDYYGPGSPLERLVQAGGKVLRLGADSNTVTLLHYAEYLAPVSPKRRVTRHRLVIGSHGPEVRSVNSLDDSNGIVDYLGEDYFGVILNTYLATGRASRGLVGGAHSELIDAADLVNFAVSWMSEHLTR
jgi:aminoglycoside N3'-acetyltransferase